MAGFSFSSTRLENRGCVWDKVDSKSPSTAIRFPYSDFSNSKCEKSGLHKHVAVNGKFEALGMLPWNRNSWVEAASAPREMHFLPPGAFTTDWKSLSQVKFLLKIWSVAKLGVSKLRYSGEVLQPLFWVGWLLISDFYCIFAVQKCRIVDIFWIGRMFSNEELNYYTLVFIAFAKVTSIIASDITITPY